MSSPRTQSAAPSQEPVESLLTQDDVEQALSLLVDPDATRTMAADQLEELLQRCRETEDRFDLGVVHGGDRS